MEVPFVDFSKQYQEIKNEIEPGLKKIFEAGNFILGKEEKDFENEFASFCESKYAVGVNSGTDALYLALASLGIKEGDEVILPPFTFIATALCVSYCRAKPVFVDIEPDTYNLDPKKLRQAITPKTKAIIVVHIYGQSAQMDEIIKIAKEHHIKVIEDAAQAHGARYKGKKIGSLGDVACFSFYPTKSLGAFGDGGMIVTSNEQIYKNSLMLRDYGREGRYEHKIKGHNSRLDTVQAVILSAKLRRLDSWNLLRAKAADVYRRQLGQVKGVVIPAVKSDRTHIYQTYAVRLKNRDKVLDVMKEKKIGVLIHYPIPVHLQEAYQELGHKKGDFPVSEEISAEILSLPMFPHITEEQLTAVSDALKAVL